MLDEVFHENEIHAPVRKRETLANVCLEVWIACNVNINEILELSMTATNVELKHVILLLHGRCTRRIQSLFCQSCYRYKRALIYVSA